MKPQVFAVIALTLGAIAAFFVAQSIYNDDTPGTMVVIVSEPINAGQSITDGQIRAVPWNASVVPQNAFTSIKGVAGRIARVSMAPGEPVLPVKLAPKGSTGGLSSIIPKGKRAITVRVNEVIAVAGFALPGSYVDILVNGNDTIGQKFSRIVLSRVKVLAIDQITTGNPDQPKVVNAVTLELTPRESEKLDLARNIGKLSLVLRNELDTLAINSKGMRMPDVVFPEQDDKNTSDTTDAIIIDPRSGTGHEEIRGISRVSVGQP